MANEKKENNAQIARNHAMAYPIGSKFTNNNIAQIMGVDPKCIHTSYEILIKNGNLETGLQPINKTRARIFTKISDKPVPKNIPEILNKRTLFNDFDDGMHQFIFGGNPQRINQLTANTNQLRA